MTSARVLADGRYRVTAPRFNCGLRIKDGRVVQEQLSPLRRLGGLDATAFFYYAQGHGWKVEPAKKGVDDTALGG